MCHNADNESFVFVFFVCVCALVVKYKKGTKLSLYKDCRRENKTAIITTGRSASSHKGSWISARI